MRDTDGERKSVGVPVSGGEQSTSKPSCNIWRNRKVTTLLVCAIEKNKLDLDCARSPADFADCFGRRIAAVSAFSKASIGWKCNAYVHW